MKKLLVVLLVAVMFLFAACDSNTDGQGAVIGTVNGVDIHKGEYDYFFSNMFQYYSYMGADFSDEESAKDFLSAFESSAWNYAVTAAIVEQVAAEYGITYEDTYLKDVLPWGNYHEVKYNYLQTELMEKIKAEMEDEIVVEEEDIKAAYDADPALWDGRATSHILIKCDVNDEAALAEAKAKAEDIIAQLNDGADFAELAKEYSDDGSASNGGVIDAYINSYGNEVGTENSYYTEYVEAAYSLNAVGDYTQEPVLSSAGYHIIKIDDIRSGYDAVKDIVADSLKTVSDTDVSTKMQEIITAAYDEADIVIKYDFKYYVPEEDAADDNTDSDSDTNTNTDTDEDTSGEEGNDTSTDETTDSTDTDNTSGGESNSGSSDDPQNPEVSNR